MRKLFFFVIFMFWALFVWSQTNSELEPIIKLNESLLKLEQIGIQSEQIEPSVDIENIKRSVVATTAEMKIQLEQLGLDQFKTEINNLKTQNEDLKNTLKEYQIRLPTEVNRRDEKIYDTEAFFKFTTNRVGSILVKLYQLVGSNSVFILETASNFKKEHIVKFESLYANQNYRIETFIIDWNDNLVNEPNTSIPRIFNQMTFNTVQALQPPSITNFAKNESSNMIALFIKPAQRSLIEIECFAITYSTTGEQQNKSIKKIGQNRRDEMGQPFGDFYNADEDHNFPFDNLKSDSGYKFEIRLMNEGGKESQVYNKFLNTSRSSAILDFNGPINIQMGVLNYKISWESTIAPSSAKFTATSENGEIVVDKKGIIEKNNVEVDVNIEDINKLIENHTNKKPKYIVTMTDKNGTTKHVEFKFDFRIPTLNDIESSSLSDDKKESLRRVIEAKQNPNSRSHRLKWKDLAATGLEILLSII